MVSEFKNEPVLDFSDEEDHRAQSEAIVSVRSQLGREYDLIIGGDHCKGEGTFHSLNPSDKTQVVGVFQSATTELADRAVETATEAFESWKRVPPEERANVLFRVAELLRKKKIRE